MTTRKRRRLRHRVEFCPDWRRNKSEGYPPSVFRTKEEALRTCESLIRDIPDDSTTALEPRASGGLEPLVYYTTVLGRSGYVALVLDRYGYTGVITHAPKMKERKPC